MSEFIKQPCQHCPFRVDVKPFLRPERGEELAYAASNPYSNFPCHKTLEYDDDGENYAGHKQKQCAGFLTLMHHENGSCGYEGEGFVPADNCYQSVDDMVEAYASQ